MSKILFNEHQRRQIEANPNVASVSDRSIQYTAAFKLKAVQENLSGKGPVQIFKEAGFDLEIIGSQKAKSALSRWKNTYKTLGEKGFLEERRGKGSTGRPRAEKLSADKKLEKAEARIRLLEAELALLKKTFVHHFALNEILLFEEFAQVDHKLTAWQNAVCLIF